MPFRSLSEWCSYLSGSPAPSSRADNTDAVDDSGSVSELNSCPPSGNDFLSLLDFRSPNLLQSVSSPAMGCEFEVLLNERQYPDGVEHAVEALRTIEYMESLLSVYRDRTSRNGRF